MPIPALTNYANGIGQVSGDQLNTFEQGCTNFAQLRGLTGVSGMQVSVLGRYSASDGFGGLFYWNSNSTAADDNTNVIVPGGVTLGAWIRWQAETLALLGGAANVTPQQKGAQGDGNKDDTAAIVAANTAAAAAGVAVLFPAGTYKITSSISFTAPVIVSVGGVLKPATGVTLTFGQPLTAGLYQIFSMTGTASVVFSGPQDGFPEWWGAIVNSSSVDSTSAINACVVACTKTLLRAGTYYTTGTILCSISNRVIEGGNQGYFPGANTVGATLISLASATDDIILLGLTSDPGSSNDLLQGIVVRNFSVVRSTAPTPPASGHEGDAPCGFRVQYVIACEISDCNASQNSIGYIFQSVVQSQFTRLKSVRSVAGTTTVNDIFWGYFLYCEPGYNLQSCYWTDCLAFNGYTAAPSSIGFSVSGHYTDCYFIRPEADYFQYAFYSNGSSAAHPSMDNQLIGGIFDQCLINGVTIQSNPAQSIIRVSECYVTIGNVSTAGATYAVLNNNGSVLLEGNQGWNPYPTNAVGLSIYASTGVTSSGNTWMDMKKPVTVNGSPNCRISDTIYNYSNAATQSAVVLTSCSACVIECNIYGGTGSSTLFPSGVYVDSATNYSEVRCTGINSSSIVGGSANKLVYNGTQVTAAGTFGTTNLAQGVMA